MQTTPTYKKGLALLQTSTTLALSVLDAQGYPRIYAMEKVEAEGLEKVLFITKKTARKVQCLKERAQCCVEVHTEEDSVCLLGKMEIYDAAVDGERILPPDYVARLERSGIDHYCVLMFHTKQVELYVDGVFLRG